MTQLGRHEAERFCSFAREVHRNGLLRYSSGNISWRFCDTLVAVSASGSWLERLEVRDIALCSFPDGEVLSEVVPSVEWRFHLGIMRKRPEARVVLHFQAPFATVISCEEDPLPSLELLPEVPFYCGRIEVVEYFPPGSGELAEAVVRAAGNSDLIIMRNHGQVAVGPDFDTVLKRAGFFELACTVAVLARRVRSLPEEAVEQLLEARSKANAQLGRGV